MRLPDTYGVRRAPQPSRGVATISPDAAGAVGGATARLGSALFGIGEQEADKAADLELATARANFLRESLAAERDVQDEPEYTGWPKSYEQRITAAAEAASGSIRDNRARDRFKIEAQEIGIRGADRLTGLARKREVDEGRASLDNLIADQSDLATGVMDGPTRNLVIGNMHEAIDAAEARGYLSAQEAVALRRKTAHDVALRRLTMLKPEARIAALGGSEAPDDVSAIVVSAAEGVGIDPDTMLRIAMLESAGDPGAVNPASGAAGLFQFMPATAAEYGLADPMQAEASAEAAARLARNNAAVLRSRLGREPTGAELYLAHQQGAGGASALLANPDANVIDALAVAYGGDKNRARKAVTMNGGRADMNAGAFADLWRARFEAARGLATIEPETANLTSFLSPDEIAVEREKAQREIDAEQAKAERAYLVGFEDYVAAVSSGAAVSPTIADQYSDAVLNVMVSDAEERARLRAVRDDTVMLGDALADVQGASLDEIDAMAAALNRGEVVGSVSLSRAADRAKGQEIFAQAVRSDLKRRAEDPAAYALQSPLVAQQANAGMDAAFADATLAEQARLGIPPRSRRVLTKPMVDEGVARIMEAPAAERGQIVAGMAQEWGAAWPRVLGELRDGDLPVATYYAALTANDPVLSERIAALADTDSKALAEGLDTAEVRDLRVSVFEEMQEFREAFEAGDPTGAAAAEFNNLYEVAVGVALQEMRRGNGQAVSFAVKRLIDNRYGVIDESHALAYVPARFDADLVSDGARKAISEERLKVFKPVLGMPADLPADVAESRILQAARRGVWVTNESADGLVLMIEIDGRLTPLMNEAGESYSLSFAAAQLMGKGSVAVGIGD